MKTIGRLFIRTATAVAMVLFTLVLTLPMSASVSASPTLAAVIQSDDFNRCTFNNSIWTFENPAGTPAPTISNPFTDNAAAVLTVPAGQDLTFSSKNTNAPRIMQPASNADFDVEAKFLSSLGSPAVNAWTVQGILVKDTSSVPGKTKWLRFEMDATSGRLNYYIGYIDENGVLSSITGPATLNSQTTSAPLYVRVQFAVATGTWTIIVRSPNSTPAISKTFSFTMSAPPNSVPAFTFTPTNIGVFAASTVTANSATPPGMVSQVDYFQNMADTTFVDDANKVTVTTAGTGAGTYASACSGSNLVVTAQANPGSVFAGWSGDVSSSNAQLSLTPNRSYNLTATFNTGTPVDLPNKLYLPALGR